MSINNKYINKITSILFIFGLVLFDLISKSKMQDILVNNEMIFIKNFISFSYVENRGAAFSILEGKAYIFIIFTVIFVIGAFYFLIFKTITPTLNTLLVFLIAGALGNLYDRIVYGFVRDFIKTDFIQFPVFNIADIYVTISTIFLILYIIKTDFVDKREKHEN